MKKIFPLNIVIFLAAFLLFQIELIISKFLLPAFGGSYLVWGACVVFFQATLLLGYFYSHFVLQKFAITKYRHFHLILFLLPLVLFPGRPLSAITSHSHIPMVIDVFGQLLRTIGLVFFVLSTTSIIFQGWLAASELPERTNPYMLYAVSNLGSFAALLSYPFTFESFLNLDIQLHIWRLGYVLLLFFYFIVYKIIRVKDGVIEKNEASSPVSIQERLYWFLLGAAGVIMFLSMTNIITYEIAPIPLLWILPLCIYLISFVLVFKKHPWYPRWINDKFHIVVGFSIIFFFIIQKRILPFSLEIIAHCVFLFIICIFCQGQLHRNRPKDSHNLTIFYLMISSGSFAGGLLTTWGMPLVSTLMIEYLIGLFIISLALIIGEKNKNIDPYGIRLALYPIFLLILWPLVFRGYNILGLVLIFYIFKFIYSELKTRPIAFGLSLVAVLCITNLAEPIWTIKNYVYRHRNYYGIYKIYDEEGKRFLKNGTTLHGAQYLIKEKQMQPITYYHPLTPVGEIMSASDTFGFRQIAVVGLGAADLAAYTKASQNMDFYEIDPDVQRIAEEYFSFIKNASGKINIILGDARISLNKISDKRYDLLIIDAFSGDAIPVHLLTIEAISQYRNCLSDEGIILFHLSNRYLNLWPILFLNGSFLTAHVCYKDNKASEKVGLSASVWVALTWNAGKYETLISQFKWRPLLGEERKTAIAKRFKPWTDRYSNIVSVMRIKAFFSQIKQFRPFYW